MTRGVAPLAILTALGALASVTGAGCDRSEKVEPPSIASALRRAKGDLELSEAKKVDPEPAAVIAHVLVSRTRISVLGDPWPIATIPDDVGNGLRAEDKRGGRSSFELIPLVTAMDWERKHASALNAGEGSFVVVIADAKTSYRIVAEVVASIASAASPRIALAARGGDPTRPLGIVPLARRRADETARPTIELRFGAAGLGITARGNSVATGCRELGPGPAIRNPQYVAFDFDAAEGCLKELRTLTPGIEDDLVYVGAGAATELASVMALIDAARRAGLTELGLLLPVELNDPPRGSAP